jgi:hypothetical protein
MDNAVLAAALAKDPKLRPVARSRTVRRNGFAGPGRTGGS